MQLATYLQEKELSVTEFAALIDRATSTVSRIVAGKVMPDPDTMRRIKEATGDQVQPNDFFTDDSKDLPLAKAG